MNCKNCQMPLPRDSQVRFCPNCGTPFDNVPLSAAPTAPVSPLPQPDQSYATEFMPQTQAARPLPSPNLTQNPGPASGSPPTMPTARANNFAPSSFPASALPQPSPDPRYQHNQFNAGANMPPIPQPGQRRKRGRIGCGVGCLSAIILLAILGTAGWAFVARPLLHNFAQQRLDIAMNNAVNQIPPQIAIL